MCIVLCTVCQNYDFDIQIVWGSMLCCANFPGKMILQEY